MQKQQADVWSRWRLRGPSVAKKNAKILLEEITVRDPQAQAHWKAMGVWYRSWIQKNHIITAKKYPSLNETPVVETEAGRVFSKRVSKTNFDSCTVKEGLGRICSYTRNWKGTDHAAAARRFIKWRVRDRDPHTERKFFHKRSFFL